MSPVLTPLRSSSSLRQLGGLAIVVALAIPLMVVFARVMSEEPLFVSELTVTNPLVYKINVEVKAPGREGWSLLGTIPRETTKTLEQIVDQGPQWLFRFSYGGEVGGEIAISRTELRAKDWRVTVPLEVGDRLRQAGVQPSAPG
ncbi:MAG TPA: hypothetical protein VG078_11110 [Acidimicrobiales bacterium]|nr:hypothetical protein [Acidimicrobiales bacterium]